MRWPGGKFSAGGLSLLLLLMMMAPGTARAAARVRSVDPQVQQGRLQGRLHTTGLPTEKQLQSMQSGLEAALELHLALQDGDDHPLAGRTVMLRMAFDLWDQVYAVRVDGQELRFGDLDQLREYLQDIQGLDVCTTGLLEADGRYRLQVAMVVHAVAPEEQARVEKVITGEGAPPRQGRDQQEASVSLGSLIRIFYKGGGGEGDDQRLQSRWFDGREVRP